MARPVRAEPAWPVGMAADVTGRHGLRASGGRSPVRLGVFARRWSGPRPEAWRRGAFHSLPACGRAGRGAPEGRFGRRATVPARGGTGCAWRLGGCRRRSWACAGLGLGGVSDGDGGRYPRRQVPCDGDGGAERPGAAQDRGQGREGARVRRNCPANGRHAGLLGRGSKNTSACRFRGLISGRLRRIAKGSYGSEGLVPLRWLCRAPIPRPTAPDRILT